MNKYKLKLAHWFSGLLSVSVSLSPTDREWKTHSLSLFWLADGVFMIAWLCIVRLSVSEYRELQPKTDIVSAYEEESSKCVDLPNNRREKTITRKKTTHTRMEGKANNKFEKYGRKLIFEKWTQEKKKCARGKKSDQCFVIFKEAHGINGPNRQDTHRLSLKWEWVREHRVAVVNDGTQQKKKE